MAEIGTYYITVMPSMNKFTSAVKKELGGLGKSAGGEFKTSFADVLKGSAIGTMLGNLGSMLGSEIMGGLSTGIRRIDTIQNFPKVMQALGFEAGQAGESVQLIMDRLDGLPTATQDVVAMTQAFADSTGDLDLATRAALGFNDMMLASGASTGEVTQAQGVLNRVLGKGSATVAQWQSLQSVMPAQLAAVARELGGESMSVEELREQLNDGTISWNDFLQAVVKLDTEGSGAVKSFRDQAIANSVGIGTALANVQNRIGAGWAEILDSIGREDISGAINDASYGIRDAMTRVGDAIEWLKWTILGSSIDESLGRIFGNVKDFFSENFSIDIPDLKNFVRDIVDLVEGGLRWIADNGETVGTALSMVAGAFATLEGIKIGAALSSAFTALQTFIGGLSALNIIGMGAIGLIGALAAGLVYFFTQTETGKQIWRNFCDLLSTTWEGLKEDWGVLTDTLSREWQSFQDFINGIPEWYAGVQEDWKAQQEAVSQWFDEEINGRLHDLWEGLKTDLGTLKDTATQEWNAMKDSASAAWEELKTNTKTAWEDLKTNTKQTWENIKTDTRTAWENVKTSVSEKATAIKTAVVDRFNTLKSDVSQAWENIKNAIGDKITSAKDKVAEMVDAIKGLFDFKISWPHIPLPHFSVSGSANPLNWLTEGVPKISVSWYAKGGLFNGASLIGVGERGTELAWPSYEPYMSRYASAIASHMEAGGTVNNYYIDGNLVAADARLASALDVVAERVGGRRRMGAIA